MFTGFSVIPILLLPSDPITKFMLFIRFKDEPKSDPHSLDLDLRLDPLFCYLTKADIKVIISMEVRRTSGT